jgi:hypothetical protein
MPLGVFSETTARTIWDLFMLLCYLLACVLMFRAFAPTPTIQIGLSALAPLFHPWRENISRGQAYPLLLLLLVVGSLLTFRPRAIRPGSEPARNGRAELAAGLAFGLFAVIKLYYAAILLLPFLFWRRWRVMTSSVLLFAGAAAVTVVLWGSEQWIRAIGFAVTWRERPESAVTAYQTLNSWLTHLLRYDATYNPGPVADMPDLVGWLWWAAAALLVGLTCSTLLLRRSSTDAVPAHSHSIEGLLPMALVVPLALVLAPVAEDYHFVLVLFSLLVAFRFIWDMYTTNRVEARERPHVATYAYMGIFLLSALLLGAPWRFNVPDVQGWKSLVFYPRLYGALMLWALVMVLLVRGRRYSAPQIRHISEP